MQMMILQIPMRDVLHFLGWRGTPVEERIILQISDIAAEVQREIRPAVMARRFDLDTDMHLTGTVFSPKGEDISCLLKECGSVILLAATLGAQSERLLLRHQARSSADALIVDAVLSAAIEAVCDEQESRLRDEYQNSGLYLTDRFSPGYGDMPIDQTREICAVLQTEKTIGLNVSNSGIMIPRKSVTALIGVSHKQQKRRPSPCSVCSMRHTCALCEAGF